MPGLFDNFGTNGGLLGLLGGNGAGPGGLAGALNPELRQEGIARQNQLLSYHALKQAGVPEGLAAAGAVNPQQYAPYIAPYFDAAPKVQNFPNPLTGDQNFYTVTGGAHPSVTAMPVGGQGGTQAGASPTASNLFSQIEAAKANGAPREDLLKLIPVGSGLRDAVGSMLEGGLVPTSFSMRGQARDLALKLGAAIDPNFNEMELMARKKLYTDLNSSSPNSMGGILSNGKSAFGHLAEYAEKLSDLHNYSGTDTPGTATTAKIGNYVGNVLLPSGSQSAKIAAVGPPQLKYGQESTKFYAGTGGGEGERTIELKAHDPRTTSSLDMAAFLESEKQLMLERFAQKEAQVAQQLGPGYLAKKPLLGTHDQENLKRIDAAITKLRGGGSPAAATPQGRPPISSFFK